MWCICIGLVSNRLNDISSLCIIIFVLQTSNSFLPLQKEQATYKQSSQIICIKLIQLLGDYQLYKAYLCSRVLSRFLHFIHTNLKAASCLIILSYFFLLISLQMHTWWVHPPHSSQLTALSSSPTFFPHLEQGNCRSCCLCMFAMNEWYSQFLHILYSCNYWSFTISSTNRKFWNLMLIFSDFIVHILRTVTIIAHNELLR